MAVTKNEILQACLNGIENSFHEYLEWSGDEWLWNAPEYLLTVNIAKELASVEKNKYITLEDNVRTTLKRADAHIKGKLSKRTRSNGRSDIILWWANGTPRGIIEVKNAVLRFKNIQIDVDRIQEVLKKDSSIEFGVIAFYIDRHYEKLDPKKTIIEKIEKIVEEVRAYTYPNKLDRNYTPIVEDEKDAAFAVSIILKR